MLELVFEREIDLTAYPQNPSPKLVNQLSIIHEAREGELVQYYINPELLTEEDKNTHAVGVKQHREVDGIDEEYYTYVDYATLTWNTPRARITRRRIDRLGVKAFPNIGAIAHYKLAYQNLSKIVAPVNYAPDRKKAPVLQAEVNADNSISFKIIPPPTQNNEKFTYLCYRITLQLDLFRLEYITYAEEFTLDPVLVSGQYICWATGYINEGEIISEDSNELILDLEGTYDDWPAVTPGAEDPKTLAELLDVQLTTPRTQDMLSYNHVTNKWHNKPEPTPPVVGIVFWRIRYYSADGNTLLYKEYVENGDNASWSYQDDKWSTSIGGEEDPNAKVNVRDNRNLYYVEPTEGGAG